MLQSDKEYNIQRIPLSMIIVPGWDGMNLQRFVFYFNLLMKEPDKDTDPIIVTPDGSTGRFQIKQGRHRFLAYAFACRPTIRCIIESEITLDYSIFGDNLNVYE